MIKTFENGSNTVQCEFNQLKMAYVMGLLYQNYYCVAFIAAKTSVILHK